MTADSVPLPSSCVPASRLIARQAKADLRAPGESLLRRASGIAGLDAMLGGGFALGRVHEFYAAEADDRAAAAGLVALLGQMLASGAEASSRPLLWLRSERAVRASGIMQGAGWAALAGGGEASAPLPAPVSAPLFVLAADAAMLLRAGHDAVRCAALGAVVIEDHGRMAELDLTASRRLALAAEKSGVPLLLLRVEAEPVPSAAETRWQVAAAPSRALPAKAPGWPVFDLQLLRQKSGPSGQSWRVEWDHDRFMFREAAEHRADAAAGIAAPLSGPVVSVPARRTAAGDGAGSLRRNAA